MRRPPPLIARAKMNQRRRRRTKKKRWSRFLYQFRSLFLPFYPFFFPGGVGGRENSKVRDTSKRLLLLLVGLGPQQHAGGAGRGLRVGNFGIFVVLVLGFRSASAMGDSPRGGSAAAPFPSLSVPPPHHNHFQVQLQEEIGRGRYGVAFRGLYKGRVVAVKVSSSSS